MKRKLSHPWIHTQTAAKKQYHGYLITYKRHFECTRIHWLFAWIWRWPEHTFMMATLQNPHNAIGQIKRQRCLSLAKGACVKHLNRHRILSHLPVEFYLCSEQPSCARYLNYHADNLVVKIIESINHFNFYYLYYRNEKYLYNSITSRFIMQNCRLSRIAAIHNSCKYYNA